MPSLSSPQDEQGPQRKRRKTRSDKGLVLLTKRDAWALAWIADQYATRLDQIQRFLSIWPCGKLSARLAKLTLS